MGVDTVEMKGDGFTKFLLSRISTLRLVNHS